jgi:radical SAM-linked protein
MAQQTVLMIEFDIRGDLCVLSHRETLTMWTRILARSGLPVSYSAGFNPHPRLSLPLPRPVGVEGEGELLWVLLDRDCSEAETGGLARMVPAGCEITKIEVPASPSRRRAVRAEYVFERGEEISAAAWLQRLEQAQQQVQSGVSILRMRQAPGKGTKMMDFRDYLEGIWGDSERIRLVCRITPEGTLRLEEMLDWLGLRRQELSRPPRRTGIVWADN